MLASRYEEVVVDQLFDGTTQLTKALQPLMERETQRFRQESMVEDGERPEPECLAAGLDESGARQSFVDEAAADGGAESGAKLAPGTPRR